MLKGSELLAKVRELDGASKSELVRECGYVTTKKDGTPRLNYTAFYEALLDAKGVNFDSESSRGKAGRKLSFVTTTQFNGNILIGKAYARLLGIEPGDAFEIKLGRKGDIRLVPVGQNDEGESEEEGEVEAPATVPAVAPVAPPVPVAA